MRVPRLINEERSTDDREQRRPRRLSSRPGRRPPATAGPDARWRPGIRIGGLVIAIVIVIVVFTALSKPNTFLTFTNAVGILRSMSTIAIVALGLTLVIVVGEIDLSFGYMYGLASILIGVAWIVWGWPIWVAILLAFGAAVVVGSFNAFLVTVLKIPSFIVTLGTGQLVFGTTLLVSNTATLNPAYPPAGKVVPEEQVDWFFGLSNQDLPFDIPMQAIWMTGGRDHHRLPAQPLAVRLPAQGHRRQPGRRRARAAADVKYKFAAFIICAVLAALAAMLDFAFIGSAQPNAGRRADCSRSSRRSSSAARAWPAAAAPPSAR